MPISSVGRHQFYQIPAFKEFHVSGADRDHLSPDTLKVIEDEKREIIEKSESSALKEMEPGGNNREKVINYFKAIVTRIDKEEMRDRTAAVGNVASRKEKFKALFQTRSVELLAAIDKQPEELTNAAFKNMLDAMMAFHSNLERSTELMSRGITSATINSIWGGHWDRKIKNLASRALLRPKPSRTERPRGGFFEESKTEGRMVRAPKVRGKVSDISWNKDKTPESS